MSFCVILTHFVFLMQLCIKTRQKQYQYFIQILPKDDKLKIKYYRPPDIPHCESNCSGSAVKLGQDRMHFSCVWFLSAMALRAAICCDPPVPSNQHPTQPQLFHTLYIKATLALHQLNMADKDRQSSLSFSQSAAGGVMARVVQLRSLLPWEGTIVQMSIAIMSFFCLLNLTFSHYFTSKAKSVQSAWYVVYLHTFSNLFSIFYIYI